MAHTIRFTYRHLPHWEVEQGRYFVTVRCADSLPKEAVLRLKALADSLRSIEPHSPQFAALQRESFRTAEKYLDAGYGACPLRQASAARLISEELSALSDWKVTVPHYTIMPNHWHALLAPEPGNPHSLSSIMKRIKGRTAKGIRRALSGTGPIWQREWFDRWMRSDAEWEKCAAYIRNNPVKAGLVRTWTEHPWTK
jgi:REP element-mobilizing transposase RayT